MANNIFERIKKARNAFMDRDSPEKPTEGYYSQHVDYGYSDTERPDRMRYSRRAEKTFVTAIYNRLALDCSSIEVNHVDVDDDGRYTGIKNSPLNYCLTVAANKDQSARAFRQDVFASLFDEGCVAIVPTEYEERSSNGHRFVDVYSMRVGKVIQWFPDYVKINAYDDRYGRHKDIMMPKSIVPIIENPFYSVMNQTNSNMQRLIRKLAILDAIDEQSASGKLDLLIRLPFAVKGEIRTKQAEERRRAIEDQLNGSKYGIAYIDSTEQVTQLNRPVDNSLMGQITYLTDMAYSQLGLTNDILSGTANADVMTNYLNRTIEPVVTAFTDQLYKKWLPFNAMVECHESIKAFNDPFKLISVSEIAEIADKFTRNEILSTNEFRQIIGRRPSKDPKADELRNKNLNAAPEQTFAEAPGAEGGNNQNGKTE